MELPKVGENCSYESCNCLDFLPFRCEFCKGLFCKDHSAVTLHSCRHYTDKTTPSDSLKKDAEFSNYKCSLTNCIKSELAPVVCPGCHQNFCLQHRHMVDHDCPAFVPPTNSMAAADVKVQQMAANMKAATGPRKTAKNEKLAAKITLMKLKGKAIGNQALPQEERVYFLVIFSKSQGLATSPCPLFVSHHWSVGRTIDAVAELMKVQNRNNESLSSFLTLFRASDGVALGPLESTLADLLKDDNIFNGHTLILEYVERGTNVLNNFVDYKS